MDFLQDFDRHQLQMLNIDNFVKQDSWARIVDLFVDMLALEKLGFQATPAQEGHPPYTHSDLLKLYLYGYKNGLCSSRKLTHACEMTWKF